MHQTCGARGQRVKHFKNAFNILILRIPNKISARYVPIT